MLVENFFVGPPTPPMSAADIDRELFANTEGCEYLTEDILDRGLAGNLTELLQTGMEMAERHLFGEALLQPTDAVCQLGHALIEQGKMASIDDQRIITTITGNSKKSIDQASL